jgi:polar amino acid transport system permease protein
MKSFLQTLLGEFYGNIVFVLIDATQWTVYLSLAAFIGGGAIGLGVTLLRISPVKSLRCLATGYIWLFQAIPLLMLLFLTGLGIPVSFKINIPPWLAATVSLTLFTSAYLAEVWRGAIHSIVEGQWEAGTALGLRFWQTVQLVIAPQAITVSLPPTVGFLVQMNMLQWVNVFILHKKLGGELNELSQKWFGQELPPLPSL